MRKQHRTSEKGSGLIKAQWSSNTLHWAKFHCSASHYSACSGGSSLSNTRNVFTTNINTDPSHLHRTQMNVIIHELMCMDYPQIHTPRLFLSFSNSNSPRNMVKAHHKIICQSVRCLKLLFMGSASFQSLSEHTQGQTA